MLSRATPSQSAGASVSGTPNGPGWSALRAGLVAVDAIDFEVHAGESFGFLGPNGAGKTSAMRMVACVSPVTSGTLRVLGRDPAVDGPRIRSRLGVVPQQDTLDQELTVAENLSIYGRYFDLPRPDRPATKTRPA